MGGLTVRVKQIIRLLREKTREKFSALREKPDESLDPLFQEAP